MVKRMLQCITNTFPTQSRLNLWGKSVDSICRFCPDNKLETLFHWQCDCKRFHDARSLVHNNIWSAVSQAVCSHLSDDWEFFRETRINRIFTSMQGDDHGERQPDGLFSRKSDVKYVLVDFNRGYGSTRQELHKQEDTKHVSYAPVMTALSTQHSAVFFPLVSGHNGALAVDTWTAFMDCLDISPKAQDQVLKITIRAICIGFSTMVDIRLGCLNTLHQ